MSLICRSAKNLGLAFLFALMGSGAFAAINLFHQVDNGIFRGSQPQTQADYDQLKKLGIKTILNLRWDSSVAQSKADAERNGFQFINIPIVAVDGPTDAQIAQAFSVLRDPTMQPVFFHCTLGRDRTGLLAALYKVKFMGVSPQDAYKEWTGFGFSNSFLKKLDEYFKVVTGLESGHPSTPSQADSLTMTRKLRIESIEPIGAAPVVYQRVPTCSALFSAI